MPPQQRSQASIPPTRILGLQTRPHFFKMAPCSLRRPTNTPRMSRPSRQSLMILGHYSTRHPNHHLWNCSLNMPISSSWLAKTSG